MANLFYIHHFTLSARQRSLLLPLTFLRSAHINTYKRVFKDTVHFNYSDNPENFLNQEMFKAQFPELSPNKAFGIICKVAYRDIEDDKMSYKMLGSQEIIPSVIEGEDPRIRNFIWNRYQERLVICLNEHYEYYNYILGDVRGFEFRIFELVTPKKFRTKIGPLNIKHLAENKDLAGYSGKYSGVTQTIIPNRFDFNYGTELSIHSMLPTKDGFEASVAYNDTIVTLSEVDHIIKPSTKFYMNSLTHPVIVGVTESISTAEGHDFTVQIFGVSGGQARMFNDKIVNNTLTRTIKNRTFQIDLINRKVEAYSVTSELEFLKPRHYGSPQRLALHSDLRLGAIDLETYNDHNNIPRVYAIAFYTYWGFEDDYKRFYIGETKTGEQTDNFDSKQIVHDCFKALMRDRYRNFTFYIHNLGNYDIPFIFNPLLSTGEYKLEPLVRNGKVLQLKISKLGADGTVSLSIKLVDSWNILNNSLEVLCKTFGGDVTKGIFPYRFVTPETLLYVGDKPDKSFWELECKKAEDTKEKHLIFEAIPEKNWSTKEFTLQYLERDVKGLYHVMHTYSDRIFQEYQFSPLNSPTNSSLAMNIFLRKFHDKQLGLINDIKLFNVIKDSYYGGITEVYIPTNNDKRPLFYYDVNSLYPYSALNDIPGNVVRFESNINTNLSELGDHEFFGFFYCEVSCSGLYLGLLPTRNHKGEMFLPMGTWRGWYFSEEVKFAAANGYSILVIKGFYFNRATNVFDQYVGDLYHKKQTTTDKADRAINKSLLNNLIGRFGLDIAKPVTAIVTEEQFQHILQTRTLTSHRSLGEYYLVTFVSGIDVKLCSKSRIDEAHAIIPSSELPLKGQYINHAVSISVSAAVTSYARIHMNKIKLDILSRQGQLYYMDTDSIVTDITLDDEFVGDKIGQFKLEHEVIKGIFISGKTYFIIDSEGDAHSKGKGISKTLSEEEFEVLLQGGEVPTIREESKQNWVEGYTRIKIANPITLSGNMYTKREKIFEGGKWVNTAPRVHNGKKDYHTRIAKITKSADNNKRLDSNTEKDLGWFKWSLIMLLLGLGLAVHYYNESEEGFNMTADTNEDSCVELEAPIIREVTPKRLTLIEELFGCGKHQSSELSPLPSPPTIEVNVEVSLPQDTKPAGYLEKAHDWLTSEVGSLSDTFDKYFRPDTPIYNQRLLDLEVEVIYDKVVQEVSAKAALVKEGKPFTNMEDRENFMCNELEKVIKGKDSSIGASVANKIAELRYDLDFNQYTLVDTTIKRSEETSYSVVDKWNTQEVTPKHDRMNSIADRNAIRKMWSYSMDDRPSPITGRIPLALQREDLAPSDSSSSLKSSEIRGLFGESAMPGHVSLSEDSRSLATKEESIKLRQESLKHSEGLSFLERISIMESEDKHYKGVSKISSDNKQHYLPSMENTTDTPKPMPIWWQQPERPENSHHSQDSLLERGEASKIISQLEQQNRQELYDKDLPTRKKWTWLMNDLRSLEQTRVSPNWPSKDLEDRCSRILDYINKRG